MRSNADRVTERTQSGRIIEKAQFTFTISFDQMARLTEEEILDKIREMAAFRVHGAKLEADRRAGADTSTAIDRVRAYLEDHVERMGGDWLDSGGEADLTANDLQAVLDLAETARSIISGS